MNNIQTSLPKHLIIMGILILLTANLLFKEVNISELMKVMNSAQSGYLVIGLLLMFGFVIGEALNTQTLLKLQGYQVKLTRTLKYAFTGFFFCAITPSASGGQPMQVYLMKKDQIEVHHATLTLLVELACFQFVTVLVALLAFVTHYQAIMAGAFLDVTLIITGIALNTLIMVVVLIAIISLRANAILLKIVTLLIDSLPIFKSKQHLKEVVSNQFREYARGATMLRQHPFIVMKVLLTTSLQIVALYTISYFVYKSLGLSELSLWYVMSMQSLVSTAVSALPLPGGIGASEKIFMFLLSTVYPVQLLMSGLLLTRGISFYLFVCISGLILLISQISSQSITKRSVRTPTY